MVILIIVLLVLLIIFLFFFINNKVATDNILWHFKHTNVIVCGKKGTGKDLLFQWVINKRKKHVYYSNITYGHKYKNVSLLDVSCSPNTYDNLINNNVDKQLHRFKEGCDIYISDGGNFLPSHMDSVLHKKYPSMPLYYSLSRHLYNNNVHINTQNIERVWKALREQADFYVKAIRTYHIFGLLITKVITYDKYESAKANLLPLKKRKLNKDSKNQYDLYLAQNGDIRKCYIIQRTKSINYNTRAFERILLRGARHYE